MRYRTTEAFRQALHHRLRDGGCRSLVQERKRIAFDSLLARLVTVAPLAWRVKGGYALHLRLPASARPTKDVDIDWLGGWDELSSTLLGLAGASAGDFFEIGVERVGDGRHGLAETRRFRISTSLAGRPFETFLLDVGRAGGSTARADWLETSTLLSFAGIEPVAVPVVPLELQVAEKLHACTRVYEGRRPSSRSTDIEDLALIAGHARLDAVALRDAIETTFEERASHPAPSRAPVVAGLRARRAPDSRAARPAPIRRGDRGRLGAGSLADAGARVELIV